MIQFTNTISISDIINAILLLVALVGIFFYLPANCIKLQDTKGDISQGSLPNEIR
jgi:hypothetical protein